MKTISFSAIFLCLLSAKAFAGSICLVTAQNGTLVAACDGKVVSSQDYGTWPDILVQKSLLLKNLTDQGYNIVSEVLAPAGTIEYTLKR